MGLYLARWGFTPQKTMKKANEQSPAAVRKWLDEDCPVIAARATADGAEFHWGDESGLRSDDVRDDRHPIDASEGSSTSAAWPASTGQETITSASGSASCTEGATCDIRCTGSCSLSCSPDSTCRIACGEGAFMAVEASGSCPG